MIIYPKIFRISSVVIVQCELHRKPRLTIDKFLFLLKRLKVIRIPSTCTFDMEWERK